MLRLSLSLSSSGGGSVRSHANPSLRRLFSSGSRQDVVGFIGLGNMGGFMAKNLVKAGYPLVVYDMNADAVKELEQCGASTAESPSAVAKQASTVVTMLPSSPHVRSVLSGPDGLFSSLQRDSLIIDASTIDPNVSRELASQGSSHGISIIDAPVSGGVGGAEAGTLTFMVGGSKESYERAVPLLQVMGKNIVHCGDAGCGQAVKVCNNLVLGISMTGVSEALNLGVKLGLDPKVLSGIFNTSSARCWSSDTYNPVPGVMDGVPSSRGYSGGFGVDLMLKDLGLAKEAASAIGAPLTMGTQSHQIYQDISTQGDGSKDFSYAYEHFKNATKNEDGN